jgi:uncharacterized membrane protein
MLIGFFLIASAVTVTMLYLELTWGYYFCVLMILYAALTVCVEYIKKRGKSPV